MPGMAFDEAARRRMRLLAPHVRQAGVHLESCRF
jgi:hypothetical protein